MRMILNCMNIYYLSKKTPYNAFINNKYETILSFSPELFFKLKGNKILTKPMKGTAPRKEGMREFYIMILKTVLKIL